MVVTKIKALFFVIGFFLLSPTHASTDQEYVTEIISSISKIERSSKNAFNQIFIYLAKSRRRELTEQELRNIQALPVTIEKVITQLKIAGKTCCQTVNNQYTKEKLKAGIKGLKELSQLRFGFVDSLAKAMNSRNEDEIIRVMGTHLKPLKMMIPAYKIALTKFLSAKASVDLPRNINEFDDLLKME